MGTRFKSKDSSIFRGKKIYQGYPFYLIENLAIGGNYFGVWGPNDKGPDKKNKNELYDFSLFPQSMQMIGCASIAATTK